MVAYQIFEMVYRIMNSLICRLSSKRDRNEYDHMELRGYESGRCSWSHVAYGYSASSLSTYDRII